MEIIESSRFFEDNIISNHVVTDQLFRYLTKSELLECSLISKKWISPCRQFLRCHHECLLRLDTRKLKHAPATLLESVLITSKLLDHCNEIFYNGIFWNISIIFKHIRLIPNAKEDIKSAFKVVDSILKRLPKIQFLTVDTSGWENPGCSPFSLRRHCPIDITQIKKLKIGWMNRKLYEAFFGQEVFPSLKVADVPGGLGEIEQRVLFSSPALQEWLPEVSQSDIKYFAQANKLPAIKTFTIENGIDPATVDQIEAGNVALRQLHCYLAPTAENVEIFRRITVGSTTSLQKIKITGQLCNMIATTPGIRPFMNVWEYSFTMGRLNHGHIYREAVMEADRIARRIFPNGRLHLSAVDRLWIQ